MATAYSPSPAVRAIGEELIAQFHRHLIDCAVRVEYVFRDDVPKKNGKEILGQARKIASLNAFLASGEDDETDGNTPFFCIVISFPWWERLTEAQRIALVDHELCHLWAEFGEDEDGEPTDEVKLTILGHDVEEFNAVIRRHGLWLSDVKSFAQAIDEAPQVVMELK